MNNITAVIISPDTITVSLCCYLGKKGALMGRRERANLFNYFVDKNKLIKLHENMCLILISLIFSSRFLFFNYIKNRLCLCHKFHNFHNLFKQANLKKRGFDGV
jgi:hypothetical protein